MLNPVFLFAFVLATMYGLAFHVLMGGNARRLVLFVATGWLGFLLGQYVGGYLNIALFKIGIVHLLPASIAAGALLVFAHMLTARPRSPVTRR